MIEESKYYTDVMKKLLNKELAMAKEDNENFKYSTLPTVRSVTMIMLIMMLK